MNFMFEWQELYLTRSLHSLVKYSSCHVNHNMITDRIGRHEVLIPINHKNYNFREKNSQVMKERESSP